MRESVLEHLCKKSAIVRYVGLVERIQSKRLTPQELQVVVNDEIKRIKDDKNYSPMEKKYIPQYLREFYRETLDLMNDYR